MASTYSTNLKLELIGTGDQSGTWGATTNTNLGTLLEQAIAGYATQAVTDSGVATVLTIPDGTSSTGRNYVIALTGTLTAARTVEVPAVNKPYIFFNNTTGGYAVTVKVSGQTGVTIANGKKAIVYTNTTDVIEVVNAPVSEAGTQTLTNKTLTSPLIGTVIGGTTASSSLTLQSTSGVGTTDSILFKVGNNGATTAMTVDTSGNVGIGTSSPDAKLRVTGITKIGEGVASNTSKLMVNTVSGVAAGIQLFQDGIESWIINNPASSTALTFGNSGTERMRIDSSGNVGIGTSSPGQKLDVVNTANSGVAVRVNSTNAGSSTSGAFILGNDVDSSVFYIQQNSSGNTTLGGANSVNLFSKAGAMTFSTLSTERMRIDTSGNVGIGTSSPGQKLEIAGNNYQMRLGQGGATGSYDIGRNPTDGIFKFYGNQTGAVAYTFGGVDGEFVRIAASGSVGIGTSSPDQLLTVNSANITTNSLVSYKQGGTTYGYTGLGQTNQMALQASVQLNVQTTTATPITFITNNAERMRIDSSGNVGIGLSNPAVKTDINGVMRAATWSLTGTGVTGGTTAFSAGTVSTDANWGMYFRAPTSSAAIANYSFRNSADTALMTIDSSGNVGIGNSAPGSFNSSANKLVVGTGSGNNGITIYSGSASQSGIYFGYGTTGGQAYAGQFIYNHANNSFSTYVSGTTLATTIDSSGNLLVGATTAGAKLTVQTASQIGINSTVTAGTSSPIYANVNYASSTSLAAIRAVKYDNNTTTSQAFIQFAVNQDGANCGQINANGASSAAFGTYSDERLKENIISLPSQLSNICALRPVEFDYKDGSGHQIGFVAQEMQQVYPDVVGEREDGMLTVTGWSKTEARFVAALQELSAKNDALEARLAKLENVQ